MARLKRVFKNSLECAHIFNAQTQAEGKGGHAFFEGDKFYSYGHHFEAARIIPVKGEKIWPVFITTRRYSMTTAGHIGDVTRATNNRDQFFVPSFDPSAPDNIEYYHREICGRKALFLRATLRADSKRFSLVHMIREFENYLELFPKIPANTEKSAAQFARRVIRGAGNP